MGKSYTVGWSFIFSCRMYGSHGDGTLNTGLQELVNVELRATYLLWGLAIETLNPNSICCDPTAEK